MPKDYRILHKDLLEEYNNIMWDNNKLKNTNTELNQMHDNSLKRIFELRDEIKKLKPKEKNEKTNTNTL